MAKYNFHHQENLAFTRWNPSPHTSDVWNILVKTPNEHDGQDAATEFSICLKKVIFDISLDKSWEALKAIRSGKH